MAKRETRLKDGSRPEKYIQRDVLSWLESVPGIIFYRQNSGVVHVHKRSVFLGPDGAADISVILGPSGRFVGLEVKSAKGKPNKDQISWAKKLTAHGGLYFIVRSVADAKAAIAQAMGERSRPVDDGPEVL